MFLDKSIKQKIRWVIFGILAAACSLLFLIFSLIYFADSYTELKHELIEEQEELFLFGLKDKGVKDNALFQEELTEMLMLHHISVRVVSNKNESPPLINTGIFMREHVKRSSSLTTQEGFDTTALNGERYIRYMKPFLRETEIHVLELWVPKPAWSKTLEPFLMPFLLTLLIFFLIAIPSVFWFSNSLIYPLKVLEERLQSLRTNNLTDPILTYKKKDEISALIHSIDTVKARFNSVFNSLSGYSNVLSHEIRNKLVLLQTQCDSEEANDTIQSISDCMDSLKYLYLIEEGRYVFEESLSQFGFAFETVLSQFKDKERVTVSQVEKISIETDIPLYKIILKNCLENALKHSDKEVVVSVDNERVNISNPCSATQYKRLLERVMNARQAHSAPKSSLGSFIIVRLSMALDVSYKIEFDVEKQELRQILGVPVSREE
jgi:hypothetical protein